MSMFGKHTAGVDFPHRYYAAKLIMNIIQLLITSVVIIGIVVVGLLAIIPALIDYPRGRDQDESDPPASTLVAPDDHHGSIDLAA
jgi:hypothetical protein